LARRAASSRGLRFDGLQGYEGHVVNLADAEQRRRGATEAMGLLVESRRAIEAVGLLCPIVSGGATGTYDVTGNVAGVDEVQAGSYALMDWHYKRLRPEFECCRVVLVTVVSARGAKAVVDVGSKGMGCEFGPPVVEGAPDARVVKVAEEHTEIEGVRAEVDDRLRLIPSHGCNTNNLYRCMWVARNGVVEAAWQIEGAGCLV
jgi:D-serine deaminase-like pyridoxal phosphate-dependent protein